MPMSSGLASSLSEFAKRSEVAKSPLAAESPNERTLLPPAKTNLMTRMRGWLDKLVSSAFVRYALAIFIGVAGTLAWQSYSGKARTTIAGWSPHLAWLAPAAAPHGIFPERVKATSLALAAVHQSVDKLDAEISRLEAQGGSDRAAASPPSRRGSRRP
jgi:hypothetical protein